MLSFPYPGLWKDLAVGLGAELRLSIPDSKGWSAAAAKALDLAASVWLFWTGKVFRWGIFSRYCMTTICQQVLWLFFKKQTKCLHFYPSRKPAVPSRTLIIKAIIGIKKRALNRWINLFPTTAVCTCIYFSNPHLSNTLTIFFSEYAPCLW